MDRRTTVLVLGVGGNVSQGILKALAAGSLPCRVVGACITPASFGLFTVDRAYLSPHADDPAFPGWLLDTCRAEGVQAVLSGVEPVLSVLARHAGLIRLETGAVCLVSPPECLAIGSDKLRTCQWLNRHGFHAPAFAAADDADAIEALVARYGFPLIAKPRSGKGGQGFLEIPGRRELEFVARRPGYLVQQRLGEPGDEYTAGCFSDSSGTVRGSIVMRRELLSGTTYRSEVVDVPAIRAEAVRIAQALQPVGPSNIQLRMHEDRPVCFEINVRFSGTTPLRARFGFNDVEAALRHYVLGEPAADLPLITRGVALRYWNELYVEVDALTSLEQTGRLDDPRRSKSFLETYGMKP